MTLYRRSTKTYCCWLMWILIWCRFRHVFRSLPRCQIKTSGARANQKFSSLLILAQQQIRPKGLNNNCIDLKEQYNFTPLAFETLTPTYCNSNQGMELCCVRGTYMIIMKLMYFFNCIVYLFIFKKIEYLNEIN